MEEAIGERDVQPAAICLGIAGVDREDDAAPCGASCGGSDSRPEPSWSTMR
jgi:hypothetical protein